MPSIALPVSLRGQLLSGTGSSVVPPAFSPADLFATGSQGIWLDPSDLTTMFADRAGTTPVTTPGTVVGLRLDKSKGLVLGAELVANGTFDGNSTTGWTGSNATLSSTSSALIVTPTTTNALAYTAVNLVVGKSYVIKADIVAVNGSTQTKRLQVGTSITGGQMLQYIVPSTPQSLQAIFVATATVGYVNVYTFDGVNATVWDNISVKELPGNHAVAPTDAARPTYGIEPKGGRRNLLTWTEDATNAYWTKVGLPTAASSAGFSTLTENTSSSVHSLSRPSVTTPTAYTNFTLSASFKAGTRRYVQLQFDNGSQAVGIVIDTQLWSATPITGAGMVTSYSVVEEDASTYRVKVSGIYTSGTFVANAVVYGLSSATQNSVTYTGNGSTIIVGKLQLELGSTATAYQRVTTAYDVTESGVATCHYVQYDGSDDSMSTSAIDFTATDKMSVFAGATVQSSASYGPYAELSSAPDTTNGSFAFGTTSSAAFFGSRGTTQAITSGSATGSSKAVLTGLGDIAGDRATLRVNGTQVGQVTTDQGTGNYGNYPLFIGRRNNATLPFNGRDFGIIVVGKLASAGEITATEAWLAAKTAQVVLA